MKISYAWLQDYFEKPLPTPEKISDLLTEHAFEVESIDKVAGDRVLDVKVLPDRSHDCLCHIGIAREVALLANINLKPTVNNSELLSVPESNVLRVEVDDSHLCKRFTALVIENIEVKESPGWLKDRLKAIGQRSINNVVDVTNYVMFAIGQPLHAYDRELLKEADGGWKIVVRKANEGETLLALDNKEYSLRGGELTIVDGNTDGVLGIAGIKGGKASEISKHTKNIILESANFEPVNIRKTAKAIGLRTDASIRFENEITPELTVLALKIAADLLLEIANTEETRIEGMVDIYPRKASLFKVGVSLSEIQNILGMGISQKEVEDIFKRRGYTWSMVNPREIILTLARQLVGVPYKYASSVLYDAPRTFDCSSFINYLYVQSGVALPRITADQFVFGQSIEKDELKPGDLIFSQSSSSDEEKEFTFIATGEKMRQKVKHTKTFEFLPGTDVPGGVDHLGLYAGDNKVIHSSSASRGVVEESLGETKAFQNIVGYRRMLQSEESRFVVVVPAERLDLRIKEDLIEEIGRIYGYDNLKSKPIKLFEENVAVNKKEYWVNSFKKFFVDEGFSEVITYAFRNKGEVELANPIAKDKPYLRANLSEGLSEALESNSHNMELLGLTEVNIFEIGNIFTKKHEYTSLAFSSNNPDKIKKNIFEKFGFEISFVSNGKIYETDFDKVLEELPESSKPFEYSENDNLSFVPFSQYPFVLRDLAVFVPEGNNQNEIIDTVKAESSGLLVSHRLFDTFTKEFPDGKKTSFAYRLVFQSKEKTLTDDEVNPIMEKTAKILSKKEGWQVR